MKTPITDLAQIEADKTEAVLAIGIMRRTARRLELDRAALMGALEFYRAHMLLGYDITDSGQVAEEAIAKARANFPNED